MDAVPGDPRRGRARRGRGLPEQQGRVLDQHGRRYPFARAAPLPLSPRADRLGRTGGGRHARLHRLHPRRPNGAHRVSVGPSAGPAIVAAGVVLVVVGLLVWSGALAWFGRLPGDIRIQRDTVRVSIPIVSMLVVSAVLSLLLYVVRRWR